MSEQELSFGYWLDQGRKQGVKDVDLDKWASQKLGNREEKERERLEREEKKEKVFRKGRKERKTVFRKGRKEEKERLEREERARVRKEKK